MNHSDFNFFANDFNPKRTRSMKQESPPVPNYIRNSTDLSNTNKQTQNNVYGYPHNITANSYPNYPFIPPASNPNYNTPHPSNNDSNSFYFDINSLRRHNSSLYCAGCDRVAGQVSELIDHAHFNVCGLVPWVSRLLYPPETIIPSSNKRGFDLITDNFTQYGRNSIDKRLKAEPDYQIIEQVKEGVKKETIEIFDEEEQVKNEVKEEVEEKVIEVYDDEESDDDKSDDSWERQRKIDRLYKDPSMDCSICDRKMCNCGWSGADSDASYDSQEECHFMVLGSECMYCDRKNCTDCYD